MYSLKRYIICTVSIYSFCQIKTYLYLEKHTLVSSIFHVIFLNELARKNLFHLCWCVLIFSVSGYSFFGNGATNNCHSDVVIYSRYSNSVIRVTWHNGKKRALRNLVETPGSVSFGLFKGEDCINFHVLIIIRSIIDASKCQMYWERVYIYVAISTWKHIVKHLKSCLLQLIGPLEIVAFQPEPWSFS